MSLDDCMESPDFTHSRQPFPDLHSLMAGNFEGINLKETKKAFSKIILSTF